MNQIMVFTAAVLCAVPSVCQEPNSQNGSVPIYRVTVVERTLKAINYQYRNGPTLIDFKGTVLLPKAKGEATIESKQGRTEISAHFENLTTPQGFGHEYLTYVLWAITPEGRPRAIGEIIPNGSNKASFHVTTDLQAFGLIVTAEPYFSVRQPSDVVVAENQIRPETVGKIEEISAKYELMPRGRYTVDVPQRPDPDIANAPSVSMRRYEALLELYQARNAVAIARNASAAQYSPDTFSKAEQLLSEAEQLSANKSADPRKVVESAREAAQTAEDARVIAERRAQQEKIAAANAQIAAAQQAALQAQADAERARADASAAQVQADNERAARERAEMEASSARQRAAQAEADAASQARTAAANAAAVQVRQQQDWAGARHLQLRKELIEQLNNVSFVTRDTPRGLVATISDKSFEDASLRGGSAGQLSQVAAVISAHPGLKVRIEGYSDAPATEALASRRAQTVFDTLASLGVSPALMEVRPMGAERPVVSNSTPLGREENRRVEVVIFGDPIGNLPLWDHPYTLTPGPGQR